MKQSKYAYCEKCDKDVAFNTQNEMREITFKGITFSYLHKKAICKHCKDEVFPYTLGKENYISMTDAYKKTIGLLTSKEIIDIRKKMKLSQTELANRIGCGAKNIARYESGAIQIQSIDNAIRNISNSKTYFIYWDGDFSSIYDSSFIISNKKLVSFKKNSLSSFANLTYSKPTPLELKR